MTVVVAEAARPLEIIMLLVMVAATIPSCHIRGNGGGGNSPTVTPVLMVVMTAAIIPNSRGSAGGGASIVSW
eukprot:gene8078-biopygen9725